MEPELDSNGRYVVTMGVERNIVIAVRPNGRSPALKFLEGLEKNDRKVLRKFYALFQRMAERGVIRNKKKFRKEGGDDIYGFKGSAQHRIGCFLDRNTWVLTHGFVKKCDKWPIKEIGRAEKIMEDDRERIRTSR